MWKSKSEKKIEAATKKVIGIKIRLVKEMSLDTKCDMGVEKLAWDSFKVTGEMKEKFLVESITIWSDGSETRLTNWMAMDEDAANKAFEILLKNEGFPTKREVLKEEIIK